MENESVWDRLGKTGLERVQQIHWKVIPIFQKSSSEYARVQLEEEVVPVGAIIKPSDLGDHSGYSFRYL